MVTAYAHTNIALVKYWGKRGEPALNLPAVGSLSLTLDRFGTRTSVTLGGDVDRIVNESGVELADFNRAISFVDAVRARAQRTERFTITTKNAVPTAAGLASSASAFAALAVAAAHAYGLELDARAMSQLARTGSGSAARSVFGGFVRMHRGSDPAGTDCYAEPVATTLDVRLIVVRCAEGKKAVASTKGMELAQSTSPMWRAWVDTHAKDVDDAVRALADADLSALGEVMEHSTLKMHTTTMTARPGFWYWNPTTLAVMNEVRALRSRGTSAWLTMDAGPHVKVLCAPRHAADIEAAMKSVPGVFGVDVCAPGPAAAIVE